MSEAQDALQQVALEQQIGKACAAWTASADGQEAPTDSDRAILLAQLVVLLGQLEPGPTPTPLLDLAPTLLPLLQQGTDVHVQRNVAALLTSLVGTDEGAWNRLVLEDNTLVVSSVELLRQGAGTTTSSEGSGGSEGQGEGQGTQDTASCINMLSALTAAAQGGEEGAQSVVNAGALPLVTSFLGQQDSPEQLQEAAVDLMCQLGTYESCRPLMMEQGCVAALAGGLAAAKNSEVRVRVLMCLGMLLPSSPAAQLEVAQSPAAVKALLAAMQQSEDMDSAHLARSLFTALAPKMPAPAPA